MPQIARLLSPPGAMNQQTEKPNVENTAIASYANQIKNTSFNTPFKAQIKPKPGIFNRLLGTFGLGENKARMRLNNILTVLQKIDERKERDYQIVFLQQEIQKEKDENRHKEIVNLFVEATRKRKRTKGVSTKKPMAGGIGSTLLLTGGALALLSISSNAFAGIKKNIDSDLINGIKSEFDKDLKELQDSFGENDFKDKFDEIKNLYKDDFGMLDKLREFFDEKISDVFKTDEQTPEEKFNQDVDKLLTDLDRQTKEMENMVDSVETEDQSAAETKRLMRQAKPVSTTATPIPAAQKTEEAPTAKPVQPTRKDTVQRAASLSIQRESGASTKQEAVAKMGQIVNNDPAPGEKSYGIFGMNTRGGIKSFVEQYGEQFGLKGLKPGSKEFDEKWMQTAGTRSAEFFNAQLQWYEKNIVSPLEKDLSKFLPPELAKDPRVLIYMADRRLQYGSVMEEDALLRSVSNTPEEFIRKMSVYDKQNIDKAFKTYLSNNPANRQGLINRINEREKRSLQSESVNFLGNLIDERSRELDLAYLDESSMASTPILINNNNVVSQKRVAMTSDPMHNAHPLV